jgi:branched-chain amino acid transport system permease protein
MKTDSATASVSAATASPNGSASPANPVNLTGPANVTGLGTVSTAHRLLLWGGFAVLLLIAPLVFKQGSSLSILSQIGTMMIFGLSYNMLMGQGGMLSFGHAVYSGLGAFIVAHAMNLAGKGAFPCPVLLMPLVGGVAGMFFGILFGYVTTRKSGTTFAMITLGIVELVSSCSLMFPGFFGGEGGVQTNRVIGQPFLGITFGPQIEVYYLIAFWLFISTMGMFAFTQTPLGRIINAVRDNPERVQFIGYDTQWVRYLTLILSSFFAGIAGALGAINFEIVSAENVSAIRSGAVLLFTFIGGVGFFVGPMIGAVVGVFMSVLLSEFTKAWQLYLGLFFIVMVMWAPGGLAGLLLRLLQVVRQGQLSMARLLAGFVAAGLAGAGLVLVVELVYHRSHDNAALSMFGVALDYHTAPPWFLALALLLAGALLLRWARSAGEQGAQA